MVKEKETLYSISKRYLVPVNELQSFNQLKNSSIKPGDILRIPLKKETVKQVEIRSVEPLKPIRKVDDDLLFKKKQLVRVAILLPFGLDDPESNSTLKSLATEFYMGVELAADSLSKMGIDAVFQIIDVPMDTLKLLSVLKKPELKQMDLIIGPFSPQGADIVGKWCKANKIRMVCPSSVNSSILKGNPYVYAAVSSDITQQRILAKYALKTFKNDQIFVVNTGIARDKELLDAFRTRFLELSKTNGNIKLTEIKASDVGTYIKKNANTVFVVPTRDKVAATKFMNAIHKSNAKSGSGTITVLGTKEWAAFDDISGYFKNKYSVQWASSSDLNYLLPETQALLRLYRSKFKADMNRIGAHGFDITNYFVQTLLQQDTVPNGVMNAFDMEQVDTGSGFENNQCFIMKHIDYVLVREEILHE